MTRASLGLFTRSGSWAVVFEGKVIGGVRLGFNNENRRADLGYGLAPRIWGKGLATEAAGAVVSAAFEADPELVRIEAHTSVKNPASSKVLKKLGMQYEGTLREAFVIGDEPTSVEAYSIRRREWLASREGGEKNA